MRTAPNSTRPRSSADGPATMLPRPAFASALAVAAAAAMIHAGCATGPSDAEVSAKAAAVLKASFREQGQAKLDRLVQDDTQKTCSEYSGRSLPKDVAERIEKGNFTTIQWPADGKYLGD